MLVLFIIAISGLISGVVMHVWSFFAFIRPPGEIIMALNIGIGILFISIPIIAKKLRAGIEVKDFNKIVIDACPSWLKTIGGILVFYGIVMFAFSLGGVFSVATETKNTMVTSNTFHRGLSALLMVFYTLEFLVLYSYHCLRKEVNATEENIADQGFLGLERQSDRWYK